MKFRLSHNNSALPQVHFVEEYCVDLTTFYHHHLDAETMQWHFPDESLDKNMYRMPSVHLINYAQEHEYPDEGQLPLDLTPTERLLTQLLWGQVDRTTTKLLVAAIEDMNLNDVEESMQHCGFRPHQ